MEWLVVHDGEHGAMEGIRYHSLGITNQIHEGVRWSVPEVSILIQRVIFDGGTYGINLHA